MAASESALALAGLTTRTTNAERRRTRVLKATVSPRWGALRREALQCVVVYDGSERTLEGVTLNDSTTWLSLIENVRAAFGIDDLVRIVALEGEYVDEAGFLPLSIRETKSLRRAFSLFRESYALRERGVVDARLAKLRALLEQTQEDKGRLGESAKGVFDGAAHLQELLCSSLLAPDKLAAVLPLLCDALDRGAQQDDSRAQLELAAFALLNETKDDAARATYFTKDRCLLKSLLSAGGDLSPQAVRVLGAIARDKRGAEALLDAEAFEGVALRVRAMAGARAPSAHRGNKPDLAADAAGALCGAVVWHEDGLSAWRPSPASLDHVAALCMAKSWAVRRAALSMLATAARAALGALHSDDDDDVDDDENVDDGDDGDGGFFVDAPRDEGGASEVTGAVLSNDDAAAEAAADLVRLSALRVVEVKRLRRAKLALRRRWASHLGTQGIFEAALQCARESGAALLPKASTLEIVVDRRTSIARVQRPASNDDAGAVCWPPRFERRRVGATVCAEVVTDATKEWCLELSSFLVYAAAASLTGEETWFTPAHVEELTSLALFPAEASPAMLRATSHCAAALERLAVHARFAQILAGVGGAVDALRLLLERAHGDVQCWALRALQAALDASPDVRDALVGENFRSFLVQRMLDQAEDLLPQFVTLGAHMLATITSLALDLREDELTLVVEEEERPITPARSTARSRSSISAASSVERPPSPVELAARNRATVLRSARVGLSAFMRLVLALLSSGPPESLRYTAAHVWLLARDAHMREDLVRNRAVGALLPKLRAVVYELSMPDDASTKRKSKRLTAGLSPAERAATLDHLCATVWVLLQAASARASCARYFDALVQHAAVLCNPLYGTARRLLLCCIWQLAHHDVGLKDRLSTLALDEFFHPAAAVAPVVDPETDGDADAPEGEVVSTHEAAVPRTFLSLLGEIGVDPAQAVPVRLVACRFFNYFLASSSAPPSDWMHATVAKLAISLLATESGDARARGAEILAHEARTSERKALLFSAGAVEALVSALRVDFGNAVPHLHALFNLSTHAPNQTTIIRLGLSLLMHHARSTTSERRCAAFSTRILENCRHHSETASLYYKFELRLKSQKARAADSKHRLQIETDLARRLAPKAAKVPIVSAAAESDEAEAPLVEFKSRFDDFLNTSFDCAALPALPTRVAAAEERAAKALAKQNRTPIAGLNAELSKSLLAVWKARRPNSGVSGVPQFAPRSTWSPRITKCKIEEASDENADDAPTADAPSQPPVSTPRSPRSRVAAEARPTTPRSTNTPRAPAPLSDPVTPRSPRDASPTRSPRDATPTRSPRDAAAPTAPTSPTSPFRRSRGPSTRRRKAQPMQIAVEGGQHFAFHRNVEEVIQQMDAALKLEADDREARARAEKEGVPPPAELRAQVADPFEDRSYSMASWGGVEGSKVSEGLFDSFNLPDGSRAYCYFRNRAHGHYAEPQTCEPDSPPHRLEDILGEAHVPGGPAAPALSMELWPEIFVPATQKEATLAVVSALGVAQVSRAISRGDFGRIEVPSVLRLELRAEGLKQIFGTVAIDVSTAAPFDLFHSECWAGRGPEAPVSGPRAWVHTPEFLQKCVDDDWKRLLQRPHFLRRVRREKADDDGVIGDLKALKAALLVQYETALHVFHYFGAYFGGDDNGVHSLTDHEFREFCDAASLVSRFGSLTPAVLSKIFVEANNDDIFIEADAAPDAVPDAAAVPAAPDAAAVPDAVPQDEVPQDAAPQDAAPQDAAPQDAAPHDAAPHDAAPHDTAPPQDAAPAAPEPAPEANEPAAAVPGGASDEEAKKSDEDERSMVRFEFMHALILLAMAKYVDDPLSNIKSPAVALEKLIKEKVIRNTPNAEPLALHHPDDFRVNCLYVEPVERVLAPHLPFLRELFNFYATAPAAAAVAAFSAPLASVQRRRMDVGQWMRIFADADFFDEDFVHYEARLAFSWSQMRVAEPHQNAVQHETLGATDFFEALCRVAAVKTWPSDELLRDPVLCPDVLATLRYFDDIESMNDDVSSRPSHFQAPCEYFDWPSHDVPNRLLKCLVTLYRRIGQMHRDLNSKCARPGLHLALIQLRLVAPSADAAANDPAPRRDAQARRDSVQSSFADPGADSRRSSVAVSRRGSILDTAFAMKAKAPESAAAPARPKRAKALNSPRTNAIDRRSAKASP
ncbi:hypothetical protein M885DRAFT_542508 [Pelagophyceae sp. CCMP2097]|nr:hypothetical protein M885DRAFT_542508 [Pelagophyceae sp. CCMP2097]